MACRIAKRREWMVRIMCEAEYWKGNAAFITLTYSPENLPEYGTLVKSDLQKFFKRLRKVVSPIMYYACGEYGSLTQRPHYHAIVFGMDYLEGRKILPEVWKYGTISSDKVEHDSIQYVAGYVEKKLYGDFAAEEYQIIGSRPTSEGRARPVYRRLPPFSLSSNGIGKRYALEHKDSLLVNLGVMYQGKNIGFPRYFRKVLDVDKEFMYEASLQAEAESDDRLIARGIHPDFVGNYKKEACKEYDIQLHRKHRVFGNRSKI